MTNFEILYQAVQKIERGYDSYDQGAPAYNGINRAYHYTDFKAGWDYLDRMKAAGKLKQGSFFPELEGLVKTFYANFWKPVQVDRIKEIRIAKLLVDMKTQHGYWARIVNAGVYGRDPLKAPQVYGDAEINLINSNPAKFYKAIADARLVYAQKVALKDEGDRKGIVNRASSFVKDAVAFLKANPATAATTALIFGFFFCIC